MRKLSASRVWRVDPSAMRLVRWKHMWAESNANRGDPRQGCMVRAAPSYMKVIGFGPSMYPV